MKKLLSRLLEFALACAVVVLAALCLAVPEGGASTRDPVGSVPVVNEGTPDLYGQTAGEAAGMPADLRNEPSEVRGEPSSAATGQQSGTDTAGSRSMDASGSDSGGSVASPVPDVAPSRIAALFGWSPPVVLTPPVPEPEPEPEPVPEPPSPVILDAEWLIFVGKVADGDGRSRYFFKNVKTGRLERASEDGSLDWKIRERGKNRLTLEKGGDLYYAEVR